MADTSFHSVLLKKIAELYVEKASAAPSFESSSVQFAFPPEATFTTFAKPTVAPKAPPRRAYPAASTAAATAPAKAATPIVPAPILIVEKAKLDETAKAKWNLFEATFKTSLGIQTQRSTVLKAFRTHIKAIHPDLAKNGSTHNSAVNFAHLVKVKDEFVLAIEKHLKTLE